MTSSGGIGLGREEGEAGIVADRPYRPSTRSFGPHRRAIRPSGRGGPVVRSAGHPEQDRGIAKPVRIRHSPATVTIEPSMEVRSPTRSDCPTFERKGRHPMRSTG